MFIIDIQEVADFGARLGQLWAGSGLDLVWNVLCELKQEGKALARTRPWAKFLWSTHTDEMKPALVLSVALDEEQCAK